MASERSLDRESPFEQHCYTVFVNNYFYYWADWGRIVALGGLRPAMPAPEVDAIDCCPDCSWNNVFRYAHWLNLLITLAIGMIFVAWT